MPSTDVNKLIEPYVDLGNLLLIDRDPIEGLPDEDQLKELTRKNAQYLFNKIWALPRKVVQDATCAQLPECDYALPREKPIPKPKEPTKWERFAKEKGIPKKKKGSKVFDETTKEWKPRYGYRSRANEEKKDWLIEIPDRADPYKDYFAERSEARRERANKQELQRLKNISRAEKSKNPLSMTGQTNSVADERKRQMEILDKLNSKKPKLAENRFNAVNEHIKREEKRKLTSDDDTESHGTRRVGRTSGRSKSKIDRQRRFQIHKVKKGGFKSKAGKAAAGRGQGGRTGGRRKNK